MTWTPDVAFLEGLDFFSGIVRSIGAQDWSRPSPCPGWTAIDVLGHIGVGIDAGTTLLRGERLEWNPIDPPGQMVAGDPARWWAATAESAREAVRLADLAKEIDSPRGKRSIAEGLTFPAIDLFVHGWDLARSAGRDVEIPDDAIEFAHRALDVAPAEQLRNERVFKAAVDVPANATATENFIAWTGRNPI